MSEKPLKELLAQEAFKSFRAIVNSADRGRGLDESIPEWDDLGDITHDAWKAAATRM